MAYSLIWVPRILRQAGLKVAEYPNWANRGHGDVGKIQYIICHHTAGRAGKTYQDEIDLIAVGRPGLDGPLSQLFLARDGTYTMIAAGKGYHAGQGEGKYAAIAGNRHAIGIEAENNGVGEPWPEVQIDAYAKGIAAILTHLKLGINAVVGHKEWAPHRKIDPTFDMNEFRNRVTEFLRA